MKRMKVVVPLTVSTESFESIILPDDTILTIVNVHRSRATFTIDSSPGRYNAPTVDILLSCVEVPVYKENLM